MLPLFFLMLSFHTLTTAQDVDLADPFRPVNLIAALPGKAFLIEGGVDEVEVKDDRIRRITLGSDGKSLTILFDNKQAESYRPRLSIWIVDKYGLPVKRCWEMWAFDSILAGETKSHDTTFTEHGTAEVLQWTSVGVPEDAGKPKYLVVQYDN